MTKQAEVAQRQVILRKRSSGVALVLVDCAGKLNFLTQEVMRDFEEIIGELESDASIKAVVFISGKPNTFLSGADLHEIIKFTEPKQAYELSRRGQKLFNRIANLKQPTVCAIHGVCLGGGLEAALSCTRRIASTDAITLLGLPELRLGFVPGLGGTQRLPRLVGLKKGLEMILGSDPISSQEALEVGLVDKLVAADDLLKEAEEDAIALAEGRLKAREQATDLTSDKSKKLLAMSARSVRIKTKGNYPAQTQAIEVIETGIEKGLEAGLEAEAKAFGDLSVGSTSRNLVSLFFASEFVRQTAAMQAARDTVNQVKTIGVVGGGLMGISIAQLAAIHGYNVLVKPMRVERIDELQQELKDSIQRLHVKLTKGQSVDEIVGRVKAVSNLSDLAPADVVIEAIAEDLEQKTILLKELSQVLKPECVIATNTSSMPLKDLASSVSNPSKLIGMHFFQPIERMPLVEIIPHATTGKEVTSRISGLAHLLDKTPVAAKDSPGFVVNRLLCCYLLEAANMVEKGLPLNWLDDALVDFGMPIGPPTLVDEVGQELALAVAEELRSKFGTRRMPPAPILQNLISVGATGKKVGKGVYLWDETGKRLGFNPDVFEFGLKVSEEKADRETMAQIAEKLMLPVIDEASRCLEEKVVRRAREIDLAIVLGLGFPPFRGGILRYADSLGIPYVISKLKEHYAGEREVSDSLLKMADEGRGFYSRQAGED